ncbi:hypothetical protein BHE74_00005561 [Ensete ventricosum]|nr:hypothetical protein BHE74_00005561 [Ensete ventricosum]RZR89751.1 hypothetical protein BHM03_00017530 [Ensete ventricosum]
MAWILSEGRSTAAIPLFSSPSAPFPDLPAVSVEPCRGGNKGLKELTVVNVSGARVRRPRTEANDDVEDNEWGAFATGTSPPKVDGKSGEKAAMPTSPRSKHSAMEQRRRCKINDR